jgi:hypothetical protein
VNTRDRLGGGNTVGANPMAVNGDFCSDDVHVRVAAIFSNVDMYDFQLESDGAGIWLLRRNDRFGNST